MRLLTLLLLGVALNVLVRLPIACAHGLRGGPAPHVTPVRVGASVGSRIACSGGTYPYIASSAAWGDYACQVIVASPFLYESGLTPGQTPDADSDYIHGYAVQINVKLPGPNAARWRFYAAVNVVGSGCVEIWTAPNGGRLAMLHLACGVGWARPLYTGAPVHLPPAAGGGAPKPVTNEQLDRLTARAVQQKLAASVPKAAPGTVGGGTVVGLSRWPDSPIYGAGVAGPSNSHLCIVTTYLASTWLFKLEHGQLHFTPPFPSGKWGNLPSRLPNGNLRPIATYWRGHQWLGAYKGGQWFAKLGLMKYSFKNGTVFYWVRSNTYKAVKKK